MPLYRSTAPYSVFGARSRTCPPLARPDPRAGRRLALDDPASALEPGSDRASRLVRPGRTRRPDRDRVTAIANLAWR